MVLAAAGLTGAMGRVVAAGDNAAITVVAPDGSGYEKIPLPDMLVTNICLCGDDRRTAYVTMSCTGQLVSFTSPRPGLALAH